MGNGCIYSKDNLKLFMLKNHLRQEDLAEDLKISMSRLNLKINAKTKWSLRDLQFFIDKYGIDEAKNIFFLN